MHSGSDAVIRGLSLSALGCLLGVAGSALAFGSALKDHPAQSAIIGQFVARYCHPDMRLPEDVRTGEAAALSRVSIKSGLQPLAWAEYLKCKAGL
jgi:hypothetical protein